MLDILEVKRDGSLVIFTVVKKWIVMKTRRFSSQENRHYSPFSLLIQGVPEFIFVFCAGPEYPAEAVRFFF